MSGIDEQFQDIPRCPVCGEEPEYWILETTLSGGSILTVTAWLFSDRYAKEVEKYYQGKHVGLGDKRFDVKVKVKEFTADCITATEIITCHCEKGRFTIGPTFNEVKKVVDYWLEKEGFGSEWNR